MKHTVLSIFNLYFAILVSSCSGFVIFNSNAPRYPYGISYFRTLIELYSKDADECDDNDEDIPIVDVKDFDIKKQSSNIHSFGLNGRSAPNQRKALGKGSKERATVYLCTNCSSEFVKWIGRCPTCQEWNTVQEFSVRRSAMEKAKPRFAKSSEGSGGAWLGKDISGQNDMMPIRMSDLIAEQRRIENEVGFKGGGGDRRLVIPENQEFNNVLGGGLMPGSLILVGGDPGVGKSTLLLQVASAVASLSSPRRGIGMGLDDDEVDTRENQRYGPVLYVSGEESTWQIASRASRLGIDHASDGLLLLCDSDADSIAEIVANPPPGHLTPSLVIIDSIQTMVCENGGSSSAGGVTQVKETVGLFLRLAKSTSIPILLVGHVTKTGDVAGPRTVEHMVDCVLYLEGDRTGSNSNLRILRSTKNRFGSSDEVGVYEMTSNMGSHSLSGCLVPISDPSSFFLATRRATEDMEGCAVSLILEGSRSMTAEIQALVSQTTSEGTSRRTVDGISLSRLQLIIAVLQKRCGIFLPKKDIFVNVVGGIRLNGYSSNDGSASDLAIAVSVVSSLLSIPIRSDTAFVGEIGLVGELRQVRSIGKRMQEAQRMGFSRVVTPRGNNESFSAQGIERIQCSDLRSAINAGLVHDIPIQRKKRYLEKNKNSYRSNSTEFMQVIDDDDFDDLDEFVSY